MDGGLPMTVTAAYIEVTGPADRIRVGELPAPVMGAADVLVRTRAVAVNHVDTYIRSGAYRTALTFPFVVGRDVVGTVAAVGAGVTGFLAGDVVWCDSLGHDGRQGACATFVRVAAERLYHLPEGVDPQAAVAVLHTGATAYLGLFREAGLRVGQTVVVGGAAGGVGSAVTQFAAATGARVLATARADDSAWCRANGADEVFDYSAPDVMERIRDAAPGGVDVYWDTSGHHDFEAVVPILAGGARLIVTAGLRSGSPLPCGALYTRDASVRGFAISNASVSELADAAAAMNFMLGRGALRVREIQTLPLSQTARAHTLLEEGRAAGRLVLLPNT